MATTTEAGGVVRKQEPCKRCGKPLLVLMVPADQVPAYVGKSGEETPFTRSLSATICLFCDGGVEWKGASA